MSDAATSSNVPLLSSHTISLIEKVLRAVGRAEKIASQHTAALERVKLKLHDVLAHVLAEQRLPREQHVTSQRGVGRTAQDFGYEQGKARQTYQSRSFSFA